MIDTSTWKEFHLYDIGFTNYHGIRQKKADRKEGDIPLLTAGKENQGVASYISNTSSVYTDAITVDMFGNSFFHKGDYTGDDNIYFFINDKISDNAKLFIAAILNTNNSKIYAYKEQFRQPQADVLSVLLPATPDGQPDWDYMESYMKAVMEESEKSLENLKKADDTKHLIDVRGWGEFDVIKFFTVLSGRAKLSNADIDDGDTPVYSSNSTNGGIFGYTTKSPDYEVNDENPFYITFGDHTKAVNIADKSFCVMDNVKVLTSNISNYNVLHFIITSWLRNVPDLGYARHWSKAEKAKIWLPITSTGKPDWQYMEDYMRNIMDKSEQIVSDLQIGA